MFSTGILRGGDDDEGTVVCFTKNARLEADGERGA